MHLGEAAFHLESPHDISSPSQKSPCLSYLPKPSHFTIPTYLSKSSSLLFGSSCNNPLFFLLLAELVTNLCTFLLYPHGLSALFSCWWQVL